MIKTRSIVSLLLFVGSLWLFTSAFATEKTSTNAAQAPSRDVVGEPEKVEASPESASSSTASTNAGFGRGARLMSSFTVFLLAVFVGFEVINKVPPTLHTPLMSGSNAISGITIVGALLVAGHVKGGFGAFLGMVAVLLAFINVVGGFLVTHRMLKMFKKR